MNTIAIRKLLTVLALVSFALMSLLANGIASDVRAQSAPTQTPDMIATAIAGTVAALQTPAASPTPSKTPDVVATSVAATLSALGTPLSVLGQGGQAGSAPVVELFRDNFDRNTNGWILQENEFAAAKFVNGRYAITVSPKSQFIAVPLQSKGLPAVSLTQPYDVSVQFRMSENYDVLVGVGYNIAPDFSDGRWLGINAYGGGWRGGRLNFGSANVGLRGDRGLGIDKGDTVTFRLIVSETYASLYLYDVLITTVPNDGIVGTIGFVILANNSATTVELDDLTIRTVNEATLPRSAGKIIEYTITSGEETVASLNLLPDSSAVMACTRDSYSNYEVSIYKVWGTDIYTAHSSICRAALHSNLPWYQPFRLTVLPGQDRYTNSTRNGVQSESFGSYPLSFKIERIE